MVRGQHAAPACPAHAGRPHRSRRVHPRRRLHRPVGGTGAGRGRLQGRRAGSRAHRLGRLGSQRRAGHRGLQLRRSQAGGAGQLRRREEDVRPVAGRASLAARTHRPARDRLRLARRSCHGADQATPAARSGTRRRGLQHPLPSPRAMVGPRAPAQRTGQRPLSRRDVRPGQRPPAPAGVRPGSGSRSAGSRRADLRGLARHPARPRRAPRAEDRGRRGGLRHASSLPATRCCAGSRRNSSRE